MLAAKNMNANSQIIFCEKIDLKNKYAVNWLFNWFKRKPTILLNIIHGTIQQPMENNWSKSVLFFLEDFMDLEFKSWLCICEHKYLKLVKVTLFEDGNRPQFDLQPQHLRLPRTNLFRDTKNQLGYFKTFHR